MMPYTWPRRTASLVRLVIRPGRWTDPKQIVIAGLILGVALTIGVASLMTYLSESPSIPPPRPRSADETDDPILVLEPPELDSALPPLVPLPDLSKVDRQVREPANLVRPRYALFAFGPQAATRVWMIEDGNTLHVDRNANGDFTDAGEAVAADVRAEITIIGEDGKEAPYRERTYDVGDVIPADGTATHKEFKVVRYQTGAEPPAYVVSVRVNGDLPQYAGWGPLLTNTRESAAVVHFGGPVVPRPLRGGSVSWSKDRPEVHFGIGTPGLGKHSFAFVSYEAVPQTIRPVVTIAWPTGGAAVTERFALARRC